MKRCLIGLGGIGCTTIRNCVLSKKDENTRTVYVDVDAAAADIHKNTEDGDMVYIIPGFDAYGTGGSRSIGKDSFRKAAYSNKLPYIFDDSFFFDDEIQLDFITTTFGGFGSAVVFDFAEYAISRILMHNEVENIKVRIIAFSHECFEHLMFGSLKNFYEMNTYNTIQESYQYCQRTSKIFPEFLFYPVSKLNASVDNLSEVIDSDEEKLTGLCNFEMEKISIPKTESPVFISYSTLDSDIACRMVSEFEKKGIDCWFAPRSIKAGAYAAQIMQGIRNAKVFVIIITSNSMKSEQVLNELDRAFARIPEGLKIMPFIADTSEMSDECSYYLCRQEWFLGNVPPLEERISAIANDIENILNDN